MTLTPTDIATVRELITYAKANGWTHYVFGGRGFNTEHLWRLDHGTYDSYSAKVSLWQGEVAYNEPEQIEACALLPARSAAMVADWLRLLGLLPTVAQTAVAILSDADVRGWEDEARCPDPECGEPLRLIAAGTVGHCGRDCAERTEPNRDPDWYIAQQGAEAAMHRMDEAS